MKQAVNKNAEHVNRKTCVFSLIIIIFVSTLSQSFAQNPMSITWQNCFGGSEKDEVSGIAKSDNGYLIFGTTQSNDGDISSSHGSEDVWIVSIDSTGNMLWERTYGGSSIEYATNIISDSAGNFYFGAWTYSNDGDVQSGNHGSYDRWVVKIDQHGDIIWEKCYGGTYKDYGGFLLLLSDGNILVYSATISGDGDVPVNYGYLDTWLLKINPEGEILQSKVFGNFDGNNIMDITETKDKGYFFVSQTLTDEGMVDCECYGATDVWAVKLDSMMNIEWQRCYGGLGMDYGYNGVMELEDGYIFIANTTSNEYDVSGMHGEVDAWVVRIDLMGNIIWQRCTGGYDYDNLSAIFRESDSGFVLIGKTRSDDGDVSGNQSLNSSYDIWAVKLSAEGELLWQECYGGVGNERIWEGVHQKGDGNYVIAGSSSYNTHDVECEINIGSFGDYWIFEIKDCSLYAPQTPAQPAGPDTLCHTTQQHTTYQIQPALRAWDYEWQILPEEAGTITADTLNASIAWNQTYEGEVSIQARSYNDCGNSEWSEVKKTFVYNCVGVEELTAGKLQLTVYPNPAKDKVVFDFEKINLQQYPQIIISSISGHKIAEFPVLQNKTTWDVSRVEEGMYFYTIKTEGGIKTGKVVILD